MPHLPSTALTTSSLVSSSHLTHFPPLTSSNSIHYSSKPPQPRPHMVY
ncbi:hypothetical protein AAY473_015773 [Plecturocebus cupreus]